MLFSYDQSCNSCINGVKLMVSSVKLCTLCYINLNLCVKGVSTSGYFNNIHIVGI